MESVELFLRSVLPDSGNYCVVGMDGGRGKTRKPIHHFKKEISDVQEEATKLVSNGKDAYFALASYGEAEERKASNALYMRSFFLDLDCGDGKGYAVDSEAIEAVVTLCECLGISQPSLVSSGYGVHAYWPLTDQVEVKKWKPVAEQFKAACRHFNMDFDPAVPADIARILRVPGTFNFKDEQNPRQVKLLSMGPEISFGDFKNAVSQVAGEPVPARSEAKVEVSELTKLLAGNKTANFGIIARKSLSGEGCNALRYILLNQDTVEEPLWYSGLSIAWHCEDKETAIHKMSSKHPEYNRNETIKKAAGAAHPHNCATFRDKAPHLCEGCPMAAKGITNPITIGQVIAKAEPPKDFDYDEEEVVREGEITLEDVEDQATLTPPPAPKYSPPYPYFRGKNGGVYKEERDADGNTYETLVYEHDFYATQRLNDPNDGEVIVFKLILPQDGEREFSVPLADIHAADKFKAAVGKNGIAANQKQMKEIMEYAIKYTKELQMKGRARKARLQFGWTEDKAGVVVGNRLYQSNKIVHNPASSATSDLIHWFEPTGSLKIWKSIINSMAVPGLEPLQFAALCGFGSLLMPFSGVSGAMVNLVSNESGTGKSTATSIAQSVFGHPTNALLIEQDTLNAKEHKMGVLNNLCAGAEEMTNTRPDILSNIIYGVSHGRGKDRMEGQHNRLRSNNTRWQLILVSNSNSSIISKLAKFKSRPDGELMRLLELPVERVVIPYGDEIFAQLTDNYGVAGPIYAQWLVKNKDSLSRIIDKQKQRLYKLLGKRMEERFIVSTAAVVLVGGRIALSLGLHDLDMDNLEHWIVNNMLGNREIMEEEICDAQGLLGEFLNEHANAIIGVNKTVLNPITLTPVFHQPRSGKVVARFEADEEKMYISKKVFRDYCVDRQFTMHDALEQTNHPDSPYRYAGTKKKRLMSDSGVLVPAVDALVFECDPDEAAALKETLMAQARPDAEMES